MSRRAEPDRWLSSGGVARLTGVSTDTLRYYERRGLLAAPARTTAGYRRYSPQAVARVRLIQRALTVGFSLHTLGRVLAERDRGGAPCQTVRAALAERLTALDSQITGLRALRRELVAVLGDWDARLAATPPGGQAGLLDALEGRPGVARAQEQRGRERRRQRRARGEVANGQRGQSVSVPCDDET